MQPQAQTDIVERPRSVGMTVSIWAAFAALSVLLLSADRRDYPSLHAALDMTMALLPALLAWLLWHIGSRVNRRFPQLVAIIFAFAALLNLLHALIAVTADWGGQLPAMHSQAANWRPATWGPTTHLLPLGVLFAIRHAAEPRGRTLPFAVAMAMLAVGLLLIFRQFPAYTSPGILGITRPGLVAAPLLWAMVAYMAYQRRANDRLKLPFALMAATLAAANLAMLYSQAPHDAQAMIAHLGRIAGYLLLLFALMQIATLDMQARIQAEATLAEANARLESRVLERTAELERTNDALTGSESRLRAQFARLTLLGEITHAISQRQDPDSIFQVVIRTLESQLPADFICICLAQESPAYLTVSKVGTRGHELASALAMQERGRIAIDQNGLARCMRGELVYEPDVSQSPHAFTARLARAGLRALVIAPLTADGTTFGVLICARHATASFSSGECEFLRQLSEHLSLATHQAQLYQALQRAYDDLRQTQQTVMQHERLRALGQLASGIAHDINNALSPAALYSQSLLEQEAGLSASARERLAVINRAIEDVGGTVGRMRTLYRPQDAELRLAPVDANVLVRQVVDLTRARWKDIPQEHGVVIELASELAADLPAIMGVETEIRDALVNLVLNAVDAMSGGGTLTLRTRTRTLPGTTTRPIVLLEVCDTGGGMSEQIRERCLEPFFTTKGERGTGLGLAMVYGMAQRHEAELEIDSAIGKGTAVRLVFSAAASEPARQDPVPAPTGNLRLLVVDDDPMILQSMKDVLGADGHEVTTADGGQNGIDTFVDAHTQGNGFQLVFTDLGMPKVDGRAVAAAIKSAAPHTPVVLLTGWGQRLEGTDLQHSRIDRVLSKPPRVPDLRKALADLAAKS